MPPESGASSRQRYFQIHLCVGISCVFSIALVVLWMINTGTNHFIWLPWNLFLAFIPYVISYQLEQRPSWLESRWRFFTCLLLWLLFLPNSFYILTDLFHLRSYPNSSQWYDLVMIFSFAWNGLLLGILSVQQMERIVVNTFLRGNEFLFLLPVMLLNGWGVYIGRVMRYNTWDVVANPVDLLNDAGAMALHPFQYTYAWAMIIVMGVLTSLIYLSIKRLSAWL